MPYGDVIGPLDRAGERAAAVAAGALATLLRSLRASAARRAFRSGALGLELAELLLVLALDGRGGVRWRVARAPTRRSTSCGLVLGGRLELLLAHEVGGGGLARGGDLVAQLLHLLAVELEDHLGRGQALHRGELGVADRSR